MNALSAFASASGSASEASSTIHDRPSASRFSSNRWPMDAGRVGRRDQRLAKRGIGQHLRELRQDLEMRLRRLLGHHQEDEDRDRLAVGRIEGNRFGQPDERGDRVAQSLDPAVRNGHLLAETG